MSASSPLPADAQERKRVPLATGVFDYFPAALAEVAKVSFVGNEKHNPGQPLHHARGKSNDHPDAMLRHFEERGGFDDVKLPDGRVFRIRHSAEMAWRALAILQEELEAAGEAPLARGARLPVQPMTATQYDIRDADADARGTVFDYQRQTKVGNGG